MPLQGQGRALNPSADQNLDIPQGIPDGVSKNVSCGRFILKFEPKRVRPAAVVLHLEGAGILLDPLSAASRFGVSCDPSYVSGLRNPRTHHTEARVDQVVSVPCGASCQRDKSRIQDFDLNDVRSDRSALERSPERSTCAQ